MSAPALPPSGPAAISWRVRLVCTITPRDRIVLHVVPGRRWRSASNSYGASASPGFHIAKTTGLSRATVSRILRRLGLNRMRDLEPAVPLIRYEHAAPGDLLHLDIKQLGRFAGVVSRPDGRRRGTLHRGWEYVHVAIDDHSRIAFTQILPSFDAACAIAFLRASVAYYASLGIVIRRLLIDNGHCYRSRAFHAAVVELGLRHHFTRPYTPRTTAKPNASFKPLCGNGLRPLVSRLATPSPAPSSLASPLQLAPPSW
jgi:transposase InsO family protein